MKTLVFAVAAALVFASSADSSPEFSLRRAASTPKTVTFSWKAQPGADGYAFLRDGVMVARTLDPTRTATTFWKGSSYAVVVLHVGRNGRVTRGAHAVFAAPGHQGRPAVRQARHATRLVFVPAPSPVFRLRLVGRTPKTVTFAWKPQPGADGYRFLRNGAVVARTMSRSTTTATFWKGSRYGVDVLRAAAPDAVVPFRRAVAFKSTGAAHRKARTGLVFRSAPRIDFRLRLVRQTKGTVTFEWKRQAAADGYRFLRNGITVAQTFDRATTRATFWKGSRYAVEVIKRLPGHRVVAVTRTLAYTRSSTAPSTVKPSTPTTEPATPSAPRSGEPSAKQPAEPTKPPTSSRPASPKPSPKPTPAKPSPQPAAPAPASPRPTPPASPPAAPAPQPAPPSPVGPGGAVTLSGSYSPSAFFQAVAVAPAGPVTVRGSFTVTGDVSISRANLRIEGASVQGKVHFEPGSDGSAFVNGSASGFDIFGADSVLVQGNAFDGGGSVPNNQIWDEPAGDVPSDWKIVGNSFRNFYRDDGSHSEALYVGYSSGGLIDGNTFTNNGNTGHVFFTWFGSTANPSSSYPRNICLRGNTFNNTHGAYFDVNFREEIPVSANIKIQRDASSTNTAFYGSC